MSFTPLNNARRLASEKGMLLLGVLLLQLLMHFMHDTCFFAFVLVAAASAAVSVSLLLVRVNARTVINGSAASDT